MATFEHTGRFELSDLVDLSIGSPEQGAVNFNLIRTILHIFNQELMNLTGETIFIEFKEHYIDTIKALKDIIHASPQTLDVSIVKEKKNKTNENNTGLEASVLQVLVEKKLDELETDSKTATSIRSSSLNHIKCKVEILEELSASLNQRIQDMSEQINHLTQLLPVPFQINPVTCGGTNFNKLCVKKYESGYNSTKDVWNNNSETASSSDCMNHKLCQKSISNESKTIIDERPEKNDALFEETQEELKSRKPSTENEKKQIKIIFERRSRNYSNNENKMKVNQTNLNKENLQHKLIITQENGDFENANSIIKTKHVASISNDSKKIDKEINLKENDFPTKSLISNFSLLSQKTDENVKLCKSLTTVKPQILSREKVSKEITKTIMEENCFHFDTSEVNIESIEIKFSSLENSQIAEESKEIPELKVTKFGALLLINRGCVDDPEYKNSDIFDDKGSIKPMYDSSCFSGLYNEKYRLLLENHPQTQASEKNFKDCLKTIKNKLDYPKEEGTLNRTNQSNKNIKNNYNCTKEHSGQNSNVMNYEKYALSAISPSLKSVFNVNSKNPYADCMYANKNYSSSEKKSSNESNQLLHCFMEEPIIVIDNGETSYIKKKTENIFHSRLSKAVNINSSSKENKHSKFLKKHQNSKSNETIVENYMARNSVESNVKQNYVETPKRNNDLFMKSALQEKIDVHCENSNTHFKEKDENIQEQKTHVKKNTIDDTKDFTKEKDLNQFGPQLHRTINLRTLCEANEEKTKDYEPDRQTASNDISLSQWKSDTQHVCDTKDKIEEKRKLYEPLVYFYRDKEIKLLHLNSNVTGSSGSSWNVFSDRNSPLITSSTNTRTMEEDSNSFYMQVNKHQDLAKIVSEILNEKIYTEYNAFQNKTGDALNIIQQILEDLAENNNVIPLSVKNNNVDQKPLQKSVSKEDNSIKVTDIKLSKDYPNTNVDFTNNREVFNAIRGIQKQVKLLETKIEQNTQNIHSNRFYVDSISEYVRGMVDKKIDNEDVHDIINNLIQKYNLEQKVDKDDFSEECQQVDEAIQRINAKLDIHKRYQELQSTIINKIFEILPEKINKQEMKSMKDKFLQELHKTEEKLLKDIKLKEEYTASGTKTPKLRNLQCISCNRDVIMQEKLFPTHQSLPPNSSLSPYQVFHANQSTRLTLNGHRFCGGSQTKISNARRVALMKSSPLRPTHARSFRPLSITQLEKIYCKSDKEIKR